MSNKTEIANLSHQLHFIVSHPPTIQQSPSWLSFINDVSNIYYSLDYISPCLSPNHFKLQGGFQLTHNTLFSEHIILPEYHPENTFCPNLKSRLTAKTNNDSDFQQYSSYLTSVGPINRNQLLVWNIGLNIKLQRIRNHNKIIKTNFSKLGLITNLWRTPITKKAISSATAYAFSFSDILHIYPPLDLLHHNTYGLRSPVFKTLTVNQKAESIMYRTRSAYFFKTNSNTTLYPTATKKLTHNIRKKNMKTNRNIYILFTDIK